MRKEMRKIVVIIMSMLVVVAQVYGVQDKPSPWAEEAIENLQESQAFREEALANYKDKINRQDFVYLAVKVYELLKKEEIIIDRTLSFEDTEDPYALKALTVGITTGIGHDRFGPDQVLSREELAVFMIRTLQLAGLDLAEAGMDVFEDDHDFNTWSKESIYIAKANGFIQGQGGNRFNSKGHARVEEALLVAHNILERYDFFKQEASSVEEIVNNLPESVDNLVFRPTIYIDDEVSTAGTAFVIKLDEEGEDYLLTANHIMGTSGGFSQKWPSESLHEHFVKLSLYGLFSGDYHSSVDEIIPMDVGRFFDGTDVAAFRLNNSTAYSSLPVAEKLPQEGDYVWLLAKDLSGGDTSPIYHRAQVSAYKSFMNSLEFYYDNPNLSLQATSGAPILNKQGQVVALNVGGYESSGKILGVACGIIKIKDLIESAVQEASGQ